ncbi:MAG: hypothetical protein ACI857_001530 [Arenicella sp.]|jgi:hypothetical protein
MKYEAWLKYSEMTIAIQDFGDKFRCNIYGENDTTRKSFKDCNDPLELKFYLLSFPSAPKKEIDVLITKLEAKKIKAEAKKLKIKEDQ